MCLQAKRQQRKLNFLITQTELYAHFIGGKQDSTQDEILKKLEDKSSQRQIDIGGGVVVNMGQEDYGRSRSPLTALRQGHEWHFNSPDCLRTGSGVAFQLP